MKSTTLLACLITAAAAYACPTIESRAKIADQPVVEAPKKSNSTASTDIGTKNTTAAAAAVLPDGRIQQAAVATDFNVLASVFKSAVVKGDGTYIFNKLSNLANDTLQAYFSAT